MELYEGGLVSFRVDSTEEKKNGGDMSGKGPSHMDFVW